MGNKKISITAEFVALMRAQKDEKYSYFVSRKASLIYKFFSIILPRKSIENIFRQRLELSELFDKKVFSSNAVQFIELGSGFSLRGLNLCIDNPNIIYVDSDLEEIIERKREKVKEICLNNSIDFPKNYKLIKMDVLSDNIFDKTRDIIFTNNKTLVLSEGLASYFNNSDFEKFIGNISYFLNKVNDSEYFSSENITKDFRMTPRLLRSFVRLLTLSKSHTRFTSPESFEDYLKRKGISTFKIESRNPLLYSISK